MRPDPHRRHWLLLTAAAAAVRSPCVQAMTPTPAAMANSAHLVHRISWDSAHSSLVTELQHKGPRPLLLLRWGTPFEDGWFAPWLHLWRDNVALPYQGAMLKRGEPEADDYLLLRPGQTQSARHDVSQAFDLGPAGRYRLQTTWQWHDAREAERGVPRPRSAHRPLAMAPLSLSFER